MGLSGGKDVSTVDLQQEPGTVPVDVGNGQMVWIRPGAYIDEDGLPRAEVRERPARTDLAVFGALAALEGGEEQDEGWLRADYERIFEGRAGDVPLGSEKALLLAMELLKHRDSAAFAGSTGGSGGNAS